MGLIARLEQLKQKRAEREAARLQQRTEKVAHQLYLQRLDAGQDGDEASDWVEAQKIVKDPVRQSLYRVRRIALVRWWLSGLAGKNSWEWQELLIVPLFLAGGAFYLETRVESRQERIAAERYKQQAEIADERAKQDVLDSYLEKMQGLLLDRGLRESSDGSEVRSVARAITTTAIKELGVEGNALLIDFLQESDLISVENDAEGKNGGIALLQGLNLSGSSLIGANLRNADLRDSNLFGTNLSGADLSNTDLSDTDLTKADLSGANLTNANLSNASIASTHRFDPPLSKFAPTILFDDQITVIALSGVNLSRANLSGANLSGTMPSEKQLEKSFLCKTILPKKLNIDSDRNCDRRGGSFR